MDAQRIYCLTENVNENHTHIRPRRTEIVADKYFKYLERESNLATQKEAGTIRERSGNDPAQTRPPARQTRSVR